MSPPVCVKWQGKEFTINLEDQDTLDVLKRKLEEETHVQPKRQKLLGLKTKDGKQPGDDTVISDLQLKPGLKVMMMGSPDTVIEQIAKEAEAAPEVADDFDLNAEDEQALDLKDRPEVQEKLKRRISSVEVKVLNPPREGKKCLVLDIDYTLFDLGSTAERPEELARPYLHEFLSASYELYDIIIWSATSMKWVEVKMKELGVLGHPDYKVTCMLDHAAMVTVNTEKYGVFDCKPLAFIWAKFPEYNEHNTIMFDDLRRNFILNKQAGLVIRPYKRAYANRATDRELYHLTKYLMIIGRLDKISHLNHRKWEEYLMEHRRGG
mmetsp:Transcript_14455/g.31326  ORF Transcript_14455/g.31326 Transcript_14455/m.31326 type:complete len:322 (-) Transcript_14455:948-1913(-)